MGDHRLSDNLLYHRLLISNGLLLNLRLLVDQLSLNWVVLNSFLVPIYRHVLNHLVVGHLGNILSLVFNCVVISHISLSRNLNSLPHFLVLHNGSLIGNVLNSTFTFNGRLLGYNWLSHDWLLNNLLSDILRRLCHDWSLL